MNSYGWSVKNSIKNMFTSQVRLAVLVALFAVPALQPQTAAAQQTDPAAAAVFSFAVYGDSRPMMYLPLKEGQPDVSKLFVEMFGLACRKRSRKP